MAWREKNQAEILPIPAGKSQELILNALLSHPAFNGTDTLHEATVWVGNDAVHAVHAAFQIGVPTVNLGRKSITIYPVDDAIIIKRCHPFTIPGVLSKSGPQFSLVITNRSEVDHHVMLLLAGLSWTSLEF